MKNKGLAKLLDRSKEVIRDELNYEEKLLDGSDSVLSEDETVKKVKEAPVMNQNNDYSEPKIMNTDLVNSVKKQSSTIASDVVIKGSINAKGDLVFDGTIDGNIDCAGSLSIGGKVKGDVKASCVSVNCDVIEGNIKSDEQCNILGTTVVKGDIHASVLMVEGRVTGNIQATEKVILSHSAVLDGNCATPSLKVEDGALITGSIQMGPIKKD